MEQSETHATPPAYMNLYVTPGTTVKNDRKPEDIIRSLNLRKSDASEVVTGEIIYRNAEATHRKSS